MNPVKELQKHGQAVWLDYFRRSVITSSELKELVAEDGLSGVIISPATFEKVITGAIDYDQALADLLKSDPKLNSRTLYEKLTIEDVQMAADFLRPLYDQTGGIDGFVSLDLPSAFAYSAAHVIQEGRHFWKQANRPNIMIKVPATPEGIIAVEVLTAQGINVNITAVFSLSHYQRASDAYLKGLEKCIDPSQVSSVASFLVSPVDTIVDHLITESDSPEVLNLQGKIAIANCKLAYKAFKNTFSGESWNRLKNKGARVQRLLWSSTSTKNPEYSDVFYVKELIGENTIMAMTPHTLNNFRGHGRVRSALEEEISESRAEVEKLERLGIILGAVAEKLQGNYVSSFSATYESLLSSLERKRNTIIHGNPEKQVLSIGKYQNALETRLKYWKKSGFNRRLWRKDPTIWFPKEVPEITDRLGWLYLPEIVHEQLGNLVSFAEEIRSEKIAHVVLLGMGGSSLAPQVYRQIFGNAPGFPELVVLDSTHPDTINAIEQNIDLSRTLFILASKSGTTLEPNALFEYFWSKVAQITADPGRHFVAISDPGTTLVQLAKEQGFRQTFLANPDLGGRYSAITVFGLVPAALIGVDVSNLVDRSGVAMETSAFCVSEPKIPALNLGAALGEMALRGRDKVTFFTTSSLKSFPIWLEQLIAESTGKDGKGILPVVDEPISDSYASDRVFVHFSLAGEEGQDLRNKLESFQALGHPVIYIDLSDKYDIGQEIFHWEVAVASASAVLGVHPFNQPDVESAKELARAAMTETVKFAVRDVEAVPADDAKQLFESFTNWLGEAQERGYIAIQSYLQPTAQIEEKLTEIRVGLLNRLNLATTIGYGPRFLHSTGQFHKGGPDCGLFLQLIDEPREDIPVPGTNYTFGDIIQAQALGDYQALSRHGRRVLRVNLKKMATQGLSYITEILGRED